MKDFFMQIIGFFLKKLGNKITVKIFKMLKHAQIKQLYVSSLKRFSMYNV